MTPINPSTAAILQSGTTQQRVGAEKDRQVRRPQSLVKGSASRGDESEHPVESAEGVNASGDRQDSYQPQQERQQEQKQFNPPAEGDDELPHIDLTA